MLAVGPPRSLTLPLNQGCFVSRSISRIIESLLRDWMIFPWWWVMAQKAQPPKQPRWVVMDVLICSQAGIGSL
jgi:hypothetical protein